MQNDATDVRTEEHANGHALADARRKRIRVEDAYARLSAALAELRLARQEYAAAIHAAAPDSTDA
jgi:hypothetical protein